MGGHAAMLHAAMLGHLAACVTSRISACRISGDPDGLGAICCDEEAARALCATAPPHVCASRSIQVREWRRCMWHVDVSRYTLHAAHRTPPRHTPTPPRSRRTCRRRSSAAALKAGHSIANAQKTLNTRRRWRVAFAAGAAGRASRCHLRWTRGWLAHPNDGHVTVT